MIFFHFVALKCMIFNRVSIYFFMATTRREGRDKVSFIVHEDGSISSISVVEDNPKAVFEDAVIRLVSSWQIETGKVGGV